MLSTTSAATPCALDRLACAARPLAAIPRARLQAPRLDALPQPDFPHVFFLMPDDARARVRRAARARARSARSTARAGAWASERTAAEARRADRAAAHGLLGRLPRRGAVLQGQLAFWYYLHRPDLRARAVGVSMINAYYHGRRCSTCSAGSTRKTPSGSRSFARVQVPQVDRRAHRAPSTPPTCSSNRSFLAFSRGSFRPELKVCGQRA